MPIDWDKHVVGPTVEVFGDEVTFELEGLAPFTRKGVYDAAYLEIDPASGVGVSSRMPVVGIRAAMFPRPLRQGDKLVVEKIKKRFSVREEPHVDSHGWALVKLNLVGPCC